MDENSTNSAAEKILEQLDWDINDETIMEPIENWAEKSQISKFYSGKHILVTGATGFMGLAIVEKLLRACPDLGTLYLLIRPKKDITVQQRLEEMFNDQCFDRVRKKRGKNFYSKVIPIAGDCCYKNLGISDSDYKLLTSNLQIIFHSAANVKFNDSLTNIAKTNVRGVKCLIEIARNCPDFKAFVHIGTAFCQSLKPGIIREDFYKPAMDPEKFIELAEKDDGTNVAVKYMLHKIVDDYTNTYVFSKQIAEDLIRTSGLPSCVYRPGMVCPAVSEPFTGWVKSLAGPNGMLMGGLMGVFRIAYLDPKSVANYVPVDYSINGIIVSAWHVATTQSVENPKPTVYNNLPTRNPATWGACLHYSKKYFLKYPLSNAVMFPESIIRKDRFSYWLFGVMFEYIPGMILDLILILRGQEPKLMKLYSKLLTKQLLFKGWGHGKWIYEDKNFYSMFNNMTEADKLAYPMDIQTLDWIDYHEKFISGLRVFMMKDHMNTVPAARKRLRKLIAVHMIHKYGLFLLLIWTFWTIFIRNILTNRFFEI